jgi:hypothetical protein
VTTNAKLAIAAAAVATAMLLLASLPPAPDPLAYDRALLDARHAQHLITMAALEERHRQLTIEMIRIHHGESDADLYDRCTRYPPSVKANQEKCARLLARTQNELDALPAW